MAWLMLILAGCLEVVWAVGLKYTEGFTRLWPSVWTLLSMGTSFVLLSQAMKQLPLGTAYAVWVGIGTIGAVLFGILIHNDPVTPTRIVSLAMIVGGIVGLKLAG